jgi:hypothetical protein
VKKFVLASLLGTAVMFAQAPASSTPVTPSQSPSKASSNASAATAKKHHKKSKKTGAPVTNNNVTPAPAK